MLEIEEKKIINETNKIEASTVKSINESFELISSTFKNTNVIIDMLYNKFSNDIIQGEFNMTSNEPNNFDISLKEKANNSIIDQNFNEMQSKLLQKILEHNEIEKQFQKIAEINKKNLNQNIDCEISILKKEIIENKIRKEMISKQLQEINEKLKNAKFLEDQYKKLKNLIPLIKIIKISHDGLDNYCNFDKFSDVDTINNFKDRSMKNGLVTCNCHSSTIKFKLEKSIEFEEIEIGPYLGGEWNSSYLNGAKVYTLINEIWICVGFIENKTNEIKNIRLKRTNTQYIVIDHRDSRNRLAIGYFKIVR